MDENDNILYLFHDAGILVVDMRLPNSIKFYTLPTIANASWSRPSNGELYYIDSSGIEQHAASASNRTWTWQGGDLPDDNKGVNREFKKVEARGSGTVTLTLFLDGSQVATKALTFTNPKRGRILNFPEGSEGRASQIQVTGTGEIKELILETDIA